MYNGVPDELGVADNGAHVVLAVRNTEKGKQAAARIGGDLAVTELDLTSLVGRPRDVRRCGGR